MSDLLLSPRKSIDYAKRNCDKLDARIAAFEKTGPYVIAHEPNADGSEEVFKIRLSKPPPDDLDAAVSFEIVNPLRSSLDTAVNAISRAANPAAGDIRAGFLFASGIADLKGQRSGRGKYIPDEVFAVIVRLKPYKGGNDLLCALNELANTPKHHRLLSMGITANRVIMKDLRFSNGGSVFPPHWNPAKQEMPLFSVPPESEAHYHLQVAPFVAIHDIQPPQPAVPVLHKLVTVTEESFLALEDAARGLGLLSLPPYIGPFLAWGFLLPVTPHLSILWAWVSQVSYCQVS